MDYFTQRFAQRHAQAEGGVSPVGRLSAIHQGGG